MPNRSIKAALTASLVAVTVLVPAQAANAANCIATKHDQDDWHYVTPYVNTGAYGKLTPITVETDNFHIYGRTGMVSPLVQLSLEPGTKTVHRWEWWQNLVKANDDGNRYTTIGFGSFHTPYGPTVWATQFRGTGCAGKQGRWGTWNLITGLFYPQENNQWFSVADA